MNNEVMVNCLVFGKDATIALGTKCATQEKLRILLADRIANGDAFPEERCAQVPASQYDAANGCVGSRARTEYSEEFDPEFLA